MTYDVILLDPPWSYTGQQDKWGAAAKFYDTMTPEQIAALPIYHNLNNPGVVFLWATGPKLHVAIEVMRLWGLHYRGVGFVWVKTTRKGEPVGAQGVRPSIVKPLTEFVIVGSNKSEGRPLPISDESVVQTIFAAKQEHSRKPDEVHKRINLLYPTASKLEMFARRTIDGWDVWGNEVESVPLIGLP